MIPTLAAVIAAALVLAGAAPASAHQGGKVQLWVSSLRAEPSGPSAWSIRVDLADADSGRPAPAFAVTMSASGPAGEAVPPGALEDRGTGEYTGRLEGSPGSWSLTIRARQLPGGEPAVALERSWNLDLDAATDPAPAGAAPGPSAGGGGGGGIPVTNLAVAVAVAVAGMVAALARRRLRTPARARGVGVATLSRKSP